MSALIFAIRFLKKHLVLQIVLNYFEEEVRKVQEKFCLNTNGPYLCIPNEKRGGSKA
jgi:hypothetical protein